MEKKCPYCGAPLPEEASFCPHCAKSINRRSQPQKPPLIPVKVLRGILLCGVLAVLAGVLYLSTRPQTVEGMGEVYYTDDDGTYQLVTNVTQDRYTPLPEFETTAGMEDSYRFPSVLYINHMDTGADASGVFLQKVEKAEVTILQPDDIEDPVKCSSPEPLAALEDAALVSLIDFTRGSAGSSQIVWTLSMENGDTIRIRTDLTIILNRILNFSSENADLSDTAAIQRLIDQYADEPKDTNINIELPAITYDETLILPRAVNLTGTEENGQRTTFTAGIQMRDTDKSFWISYMDDIDFVGDGSGVGISAAGRLWTRNCRFSGWKTAILSFGYVWINTTDCTFEDNGIALHYNSTDVTASDSHFTGNLFTGNDTAVLLENVPTNITMDFGGCVFTDNGTDIDNRCSQPVDISQAIFQ